MKNEVLYMKYEMSAHYKRINNICLYNANLFI